MTDMKSIAADGLSNAERYRLLISTVVPRPIAWVSSVNEAGDRNLAPFSFFQALSGTPPYVMLSIGKKYCDGRPPKDTLSNIAATKSFVVNLVTRELSEQMNVTAAEFGPEVNEFEKAGLTEAASTLVPAPRVAESPVATECRLTQLVELPGSDYTLVIGEVLLWHVREDLLTDGKLIDYEKLRPVARAAANDYVEFGGVFTMERP